MRLHYVLSEAGEPKAVDDLLEWAAWLEGADEQRRLALDDVAGRRVSTVFLGLDHDFSGKGPPVLFETMVFAGDSMSDEYCQRYSSRADALNRHRAIVACLRRGERLDQE